MAARGRQKKPNATKSMKELTKLEKEAEARSEKRRANIARNKAAGNAGLSSQRLTRMEAEAERKAADRRAARNKPSTVTVDPTERINKPNTKTSSAMTRAKEIAKKAVPAGRVIGRFAGPVGLAAGAIEVLSALPDSVKKSGLTGGGRMDRNKKNKTKVGTGSSGPSTRQSNKTTKAPSTPNTPKAPSTSNTPKAPSTPNTPKAPSTPNTPKAPSTSTSQGEPRSIAEAKSMKKDYFIGKDGKRKAAVSAEELKASGMSLRDYLNKQQGKTRKSD